MKYIYGIGLPRTGTTSLGGALSLLNIKGESICILNKCSRKSNNNNSNDSYFYSVENDFYKNIDNPKTLDFFVNNKFILTNRDCKTWKQSIEKFKYSNEKEYNYLEKINPDDYKELIIKLFKKHNCSSNLLIINIFETSHEILWKSIIEFLELDINNYINLFDIEFPNIKL